MNSKIDFHAFRSAKRLHAPLQDDNTVCVKTLNPTYKGLIGLSVFSTSRGVAQVFFCFSGKYLYNYYTVYHCYIWWRYSMYVEEDLESELDEKSVTIQS